MLLFFFYKYSITVNFMTEIHLRKNKTRGKCIFIVILYLVHRGFFCTRHVKVEDFLPSFYIPPMTISRKIILIARVSQCKEVSNNQKGPLDHTFIQICVTIHIAITSLYKTASYSVWLHYWVKLRSQLVHGNRQLKSEPQMDWAHLSLCQLSWMGMMLPAACVTCLTSDWPSDWEDWEQAVWHTVVIFTLSGWHQAAGLVFMRATFVFDMFLKARVYHKNMRKCGFTVNVTKLIIIVI